MRISLNGETREFDAPLTIPELVRHLDLPAPLLLIEQNGEALHQSEWDGRQVADGDRIEILRVAAGG